jgi:alkylation response protein AidB-like acyl-CoA dehydrogenase
VLDGKKSVVSARRSAHQLIVSARTAAGTSLFVVDSAAGGCGPEPQPHGRRQRVADVAFTGVKLAPTRCWALKAAPAAHRRGVDFATALLCAEAVGAMKSANDATLDYMKTRKQFGVAIASFQVLQHRMVEM